jgi:hypothetical protein
MPDNWTYVAAAYVLAAVVFGGYWRWLGQKERDLTTLATSRSRQPSMPAHPRSEPGSRPPLQT